MVVRLSSNTRESYVIAIGNSPAHRFIPKRLVPSRAVCFRTMAGEELHKMGSDGIDAAKRWLESTTRAEVRWVVPDKIAVSKLTFDKANGSAFSFDIGGSLRGGDVDQQEFFGEVKKYKDASDQGTHFQHFLAKCFRAYTAMPARCDCFLWITWAPFTASTWSQLDSPESISAAVKKHWKYNYAAEADAKDAEVNADISKAVSDRTWRIVLSDYQIDHLSMSPQHRAVIASYEIDQGRSSQ